jgi:hypothetical protein
MPSWRAERAERLLLANATRLFFDRGSNGAITWVNSAGTNIPDLKPEKYQNLAPGTPSGRPRAVPKLGGALRDGSDYAIEVRHRRHDGVCRWFRPAPQRRATAPLDCFLVRFKHRNSR